MKPLAAFTKTLRPEARLLLCCGRIRTDDYTGKKIRSLIGAGIDWDYLLGLSRVHNMLPLLHRNLEAHFWETVPKTVQEQLQNHSFANTRRNLALTGELLRLLELLKAQGRRHPCRCRHREHVRHLSVQGRRVSGRRFRGNSALPHDHTPRQRY